jgi:hypothetical protein
MPELIQDIEQLIYTSSSTGLQGTPGLQVRAASKQLSKVQNALFLAVNPYLKYDLPEGMSAYTLNLADAPVDLTLADTGKERILLQRVYAGKDHYGRPGNFFIHALAGLPQSFTARDAIRLWRSSFWRKSTEGLSPYEYDLLTLPLGTIQGYRDEIAHRWDFQPANIREWLQFAIHAFLTMRPDGRLYIAAPPDTVALIIYGLTECLPVGLLDHLTFSTYTRDVTDAQETLVGTFWPTSQASTTSTTQTGQSSQRDLPPACYTGKNLTLNCFTGKRSELQPVSRTENYAAFASICIGGGEAERNKIRQIVTSAESMEVKSIDKFLLVYFISTSGASKLSNSDIKTLFEMPQLAADLLPKEDIQKAVISLALKNTLWWEMEGKHALTRLRGQARDKPGLNLSGPLYALAQRAIIAALEPINNGNQKEAALLMDMALAALPPGDKGPWLTLFHKLSGDSQPDPQLRYTWSVRAWLLKGWGGVPEIINKPEIQPWIRVPWGELGALLAVALPGRWHKAAVSSAISRNDLGNSTEYTAPRDVISLVERHQDLFQEVFQLYAADPHYRQRGKEFFYRLIDLGYKPPVDLVITMLEPAVDDTSYVQGILERAPLDPKDVKVLLEHSTFNKLAKSLQHTPAMTKLLRNYLDSYDRAEDLKQPQAIPMLRKIVDTLEWSSREARQARAMLTIATFLQGSTPITEYNLKELAAVRDYMDIPSDPVLAREIVAALASQVTTKQQIEEALRIVGKPLANSQSSLYTEMVRAATNVFKRKQSPRYLLPFLEFGMERELPDPSKKAVEQLIASLQKPTLEEIDRVAENSWSDPTQQRWRAYRGKTRLSDRLKGLVNGALFFPLIGAMGLVLMALLYLTVDKFFLRSIAASGSAQADATITATQTASANMTTAAMATEVSPTRAAEPTIEPTKADAPASVATNIQPTEVPVPTNPVATVAPVATTASTNPTSLPATEVLPTTGPNIKPTVPPGYSIYHYRPTDGVPSQLAEELYENFGRYKDFILPDNGEHLNDITARDVQSGDILWIPLSGLKVIEPDTRPAKP